MALAYPMAISSAYKLMAVPLPTMALIQQKIDICQFADDLDKCPDLIDSCPGMGVYLLE
jgi:hypothetical protein